MKLKRISLGLGGLFIMVCLLVGVFIWSFNSKVGRIQRAAAADPVGAQFLELYPGAINYEISTSTSIYLETIAGSNAIRLTLELSQEPIEYTLSCYQATTDKVFFSLNGSAEEISSKLKAEECFNL